MTIYICSTILLELLMLSMAIHVLRYPGFDKTQKTWFELTFFSIMLCSLAELTVHSGYYAPAYAGVLTVLTVIQFSLSPMLAVLFSGALGLHAQAKKASWLLLPNVLIEAVCMPFGWIFYFDSTGYHRGRYFMIYEVVYAVGMLYLIVSLILVGRRFRHRDFATVLMVVVVLLGGIVPMTLFKLNVAYIAIGLIACLCYIYYNDLTQQDTMDALISHQKRIAGMQTHIISGLANLIEDRDTETGEHVARTSEYVKRLAEHAVADGVYADQIDSQFIDRLYALAPLHDVGKIVVPDHILSKPAKLTAEEFEEMKRHATVGGGVVRQILGGIADEDYLAFAADIATYHHEWWNGKGYPKGLSTTEIPLSARFMALADVFDALVSKRCYKEAYPSETAFRIIEEESGTHFDPKLTEVFLAHREEFVL